MSDLAGHLFVLGIALLAIPITATVGPVVTWTIGGCCILAAIYVYYDTENGVGGPTSRTSDEYVNCTACGARVPSFEDSCEHCSAPL